MKSWTEGKTVLQQVMLYQKLSARKLAKGSGIPLSTTARIVQGEVPSLHSALRISRYLKVRVEDVFGHFV